VVTYHASARATMCKVNFACKSFHAVELIFLNVADVLVTQKASFTHSCSPESKRDFVMRTD